MRAIQQKLYLPTENRYIAILLMVLMLTSCIGFLATDIYAPSMPAMVTYFKTQGEVIRLTVTIYILAFAIGQLIYGVLSDAFGRKPALLLGLSVSFIGTLIAAVSTSVTLFFIGRFVQGLGFAVSNSLVRTIVRDSFQDRLFINVNAWLSAGLCTGFIFAPLFGAFIETHYGWQVIFYFVLGYLILMLVLHYICLPETHATPDRQHIQISNMLNNYKKLLLNKTFLANSLCGGAAITGILTFYIVTPFMLQEGLKMSVTLYGWATLGFSTALVIGILFSSYLTRYISIQKVVTIGMIIMVLGSVVGLIFGYEHYFSVFSVIFPFSIYSLGVSFAFSLSMICAFAQFDNILGMAGAIYVFIRMLIGFFGTMVMSLINAHSLLSVSSALFCFSFIIYMIYLVLLNTHRDRVKV